MTKRSCLLFTSLAITALALMGFSPVASADMIYVDNGITITGYVPGNPAVSSNLSNTPGAAVISMAFTAQNVLLTADNGATPGSGGIYEYSSSGSPSLFNAANIANPVGLAIDGNGNVYVGANGGTTIEELSPTGVLIGDIAAATGIQAQSLAVDSSGDLYAVDNNTGNVYEYFAGGGSKTYSSAPLANGDNFGMTFDGAGDLFVTYNTFSGGGLYELSPTGALSTFYTTSNTLPADLVYDGDSHDLYMSYANSSNGSGGGIEVFANNGGGTVVATPTNFETFSTGSLYAIGYEAPEPGTPLLLAGGLLAIFLYRSRRARQSVA